MPNYKINFYQLAAAIFLSAFAVNAPANPTGLTVASGSASAHSSGSQLTITTGNSAVLNWQSFNIAAGESTIFNQPNAYSVVINNIHDANASQIYGNLQANGIVVLMNASGFYFGPNSFVKTGGLIVSTANCLPPQNMGGSWEFNGPPPLASIVNYGQITVGKNGSAFLIADQVENYGTIEAPDGSIGLASGQTVLLSERPDGRGMSMSVTLPGGSVNNDGKLVADAGTISLQAKVVNQDGLVQANSVQNQNGVIELVASDSLDLGADSKILAQGDDSSGGSAGGNVTLKSEKNFSDVSGSEIVTTGGANGGNGGNVEISAPNILSLKSTVNAGAQVGWSGGIFSLDPVDIVLGTTSSSPPDNNGTIDGSSGSGVFYVNVNSEFQNVTAGQILLKASGNIYLGDGIVNADGSFTPFNGVAWDLTSSTGGQTSGQLLLQAGGNIIFVDGSLITDANNWSVSLQAGYNFNNNSVSYGAGNIYLGGDPNFGGTGSGSIRTAMGSISLEAGQDILLGSGFAVTTGGGSINAHALAGNIDTGSDAQGYKFNSSAGSLSQAYDLSDGLGGISTAAGGDVTLVAGGDVTSVLPVSVGSGKIGYVYDGNSFTSLASGHNDFSTAGSGAYGNQAGQVGDVTIVAGGNVTGHYLVANGIGSIYAGVKMDVNGNPITDLSGNYVLGNSGSAGMDANKYALALSLISGGWNVTAAQNIYLQEVRNPNGVFDVNGGAAYNHYFDYAPSDYVNLIAGNLVQLGASPSTLPRLTGIQIPIIYPSTLDITAGAGGVQLIGGATAPFNQLILFPSPQGSLTIDTTDGGSLVGNLPSSGGAPQIFNLIVSDSGKNQYKLSGDFGLNDHAATPVHLTDPTPVNLDISGNISLMLLCVPEAAQINVGGDMDNSRFQGMNLFASDTTSINVTGDIKNRSSFTSVDLSLLSQSPNWQAPDLSFLGEAVNNTIGGTSIPAATLVTSIYYNAATKTLTYQNIPGFTLASVLNLLQNLTVQKVDNEGNPLWLDPEQTIPDTKTVSVLNSATAQALLTQAAADNVSSGLASTAGLPSGSYGYTIGGGGTFDISAHNIDLGTSAGIQSKGVALYNVGSTYPLATLFNQGADINLSTSGNLTMFSSSIASLNGGKISVNVGGVVNVGSSEFSVNTFATRGIYSTSGGDVSVIAGSDINVNGSRIVTYDGGNVTVESLNGSINAGTGVSLPVTVQGYFVDPITHTVYINSPQIPFSGILALTFPDRDSSYPAPAATLGNILVEAPNGSVNANLSGILQVPLNHLNYPDATTVVLTGYELRDSENNPVTAANWFDGTADFVSADRNIYANGSGIIASNAKLNASGSIYGLIFARNNIDINAQQNVDVTALGGANVSVNSGGTISGTIIGVGSVTASGGSIDASLISANVSGGTSGQSGLGQGSAANAASQSASNDDSTKVAKTDDSTDDDDPKKKKKGIALAQKVSRVTVLLPKKD